MKLFTRRKDAFFHSQRMPVRTTGLEANDRREKNETRPDNDMGRTRSPKRHHQKRDSEQGKRVQDTTEDKSNRPSLLREFKTDSLQGASLFRSLTKRFR